MDGEKEGVLDLLEKIDDYIPPPKVDINDDFKMLIT